MTEHETIISTSLDADGKLTLSIYEKHSENGPGQCIFKRELDYGEAAALFVNGFRFLDRHFRNLGI